jgi:hypothetical protein
MSYVIKVQGRYSIRKSIKRAASVSGSASTGGTSGRSFPSHCRRVQAFTWPERPAIDLASFIFPALDGSSKVPDVSRRAM